MRKGVKYITYGNPCNKWVSMYPKDPHIKRRGQGGTLVPPLDGAS